MLSIEMLAAQKQSLVAARAKAHEEALASMKAELVSDLAAVDRLSTEGLIFMAGANQTMTIAQVDLCKSGELCAAHKKANDKVVIAIRNFFNQSNALAKKGSEIKALKEEPVRLRTERKQIIALMEGVDELDLGIFKAELQARMEREIAIPALITELESKMADSKKIVKGNKTRAFQVIEDFLSAGWVEMGFTAPEEIDAFFRRIEGGRAHAEEMKKRSEAKAAKAAAEAERKAKAEEAKAKYAYKPLSGKAKVVGLVQK